MALNYDLSDPTDLEMLNAEFESHSTDDWQEYIDFSLLPENKKSFSYDERGVLMQMRKKALYGSFPTPKQILWALKIVERIEEMRSDK